MKNLQFTETKQADVQVQRLESVFNLTEFGKFSECENGRIKVKYHERSHGYYD